MEEKLANKINLLRHKLLNELAKIYANRTSEGGEAIDVGMTLNQIEDFLGDDKEYIDYIVSELFVEKEIIFFELKRGKGYMINDTKGISALVNNRYKDRVELKKLNKNSIYISSILSLVTVGVLLTQTFTTQKVLLEYDVKQQKSQEKQLKLLETLIEKHHNHHNIDSLIVAAETKTKKED